MNIQVGEIIMDRVTKQRIIFPNKSRKYLLACLREYGEEFAFRISDIFKVAVGLGDIVVRNRGFKHEKHLFVLVDVSVAYSFFVTWMEYFKKHKAYQDDYVFGNFTKSNLHMFIIKFPEKYYDAFETFKLGEYSKMYKKADIDRFFSNHKEYSQVLLKDKNYRFRFARQLNAKYGTTLTAGDISEDMELDEPPTEESEIFNTHLKK